MSPLLHRQPLLLLFFLVAPCAGLRALREQRQPEHVALFSEEGEGPRLLRPGEHHTHSKSSHGHHQGSENGGHHFEAASAVKAAPARNEMETCTSIQNRGTHFTARIEVGTPPQPFDVVADTGSDSILVASCLCRQNRNCHKEAKCYKGYNHSSTFAIPAADMSSVPVVDLSFGSGKIQAVVSSDVVRVGAARATMDNGLLLIIDQALRMPGPFEGILGLGLPRSNPTVIPPPEEQGSGILADKKDAKVSPAAAAFPANTAKRGWGFSKNQVSPPVIVQFTSNTTKAGPHEKQVNPLTLQLYSDGIPVSEPPPPRLPKKTSIGNEVEGPVAEYTARSFLQAAGIPRFSMCFNDGSDGVLRLGGPPDAKALGSIGTEHWGLEMTGLQVGDVSAPVVICGPDTPLRPGQKTACGAIPDSGTTVFMGPAEHLVTVFAAICDNWERCRKHAEMYPEKAKHEVLNAELYLCEDWIEQEGLQNLPPLRINLRGSGGQKQTLEIPPRLWVLEITQAQVPETKKHLWGLFGKKPKAKEASVPKKRCTPAFGLMDYNTTKNGPVWVLGSSVFYQYQVGYDMEHSPPSISFSKAPCGTCERQTSLFAGNSEIRLGAPQAAAPAPPPPRRDGLEMPRRLSGPILSKELDTTRPL